MIVHEYVDKLYYEKLVIPAPATKSVSNDGGAGTPLRTTCKRSMKSVRILISTGSPLVY